jgi:ABC-type multidrug transport system permease subunit
MMARILAVFKARNLEFVRDRSAMAWSLFIPFVLVFGLGLIFSRGDTDQFTVAVHDAGSSGARDHPFFETRFINFVPVTDLDDAIAKVGRHQFDLLIQPRDAMRYWINPDSPAAYIVERLLLQVDPSAQQQAVSGAAVRYVDWLLPGILGMNMMFGCLFGIGYVIVRYRKNGFLKRLRATPLRAFEFIAAQALSRLVLTLGAVIFVFVAVKLILDIRMEGSYLALLLIAVLGGGAMISLSLTVASRIDSEELAGGLLNMLSFPMMLLSGVFFSLEGSPEWLQLLAQALPLTQMLVAARAVMLDGAGLADIALPLAILSAMTAAFLALSSVLFKWRFT